MYYCVINQPNRINLPVCYIHTQLYLHRLYEFQSYVLGLLIFCLFVCSTRQRGYVCAVCVLRRRGHSDTCLLALIHVRSFICWRFSPLNPKRRSFIFMLTRVPRWVVSWNRWTQSTSSYSISVRSAVIPVPSKTPVSKMSALLGL